MEQDAQAAVAEVDQVPGGHLSAAGVVDVDAVDAEVAEVAVEDQQRQVASLPGRIIAYYYGMISCVDAHLGRLLDAMEAAGQADNTLIVFTADHGELLGDHRLLFKGASYNGVLNVPLLIRLSRRRAGTRVQRGIAQTYDLMPTMLDLAGVEIPPAVRGVTLRGTFADEHASAYDDAFVEYQTCVRTRRTRHAMLTWHGPDTQSELYDLTNDPDCLHNRWNAPQAAPLQRELLSRLERRLAGTSDDSDLRPAGHGVRTARRPDPPVRR